MSRLSEIVTDHNLIEAAKSGRRDAMDELFRRYDPAVKAELRFHKVPERDREDVAQEVRLNIFRRLANADDPLEIERSFRSLIRKILVRRVLDYLRGEKRHPDRQPSGGTTHADWLSNQSGGEELTDPELNDPELTDPVTRLIDDPSFRERAVARLQADISDRQFEIFKRVFDVPRWESFPYQKQVAADLGLSEGVVSDAMKIARRRFKAILHEEMDRDAS